MSGKIAIVGIGPGDAAWLAPAARVALEQADVIVGYVTYLKQIAEIAPQVPRETSGMRHEVERARRALELARAGRQVALISGGDPGIYGMAGLVFEWMAAEGTRDVEVEVLPGISALNAAAALLGAPLMNDFCAVSLSDCMTPLDEILNRVAHAAQAGFVLCLYNPRSRTRTEPFERACQMLCQYLDVETTVGIVEAAFRPGQVVRTIRLRELAQMDIGMDAMVIVGNATTRVVDGKMVTQRGYELTSPPISR